MTALTREQVEELRASLHSVVTCQLDFSEEWREEHRKEVDALCDAAASGLRESWQQEAKRYRWLRDSDNAFPLFFIAQRAPHGIVVQFRGDLADANIDAMLAAAPEPPVTDPSAGQG